MKYKNYFNFELGNRDIYSHNDILGMTVQDLFDQELPLSYQYNTIGIPKDDELKASPNTHQYRNANGKLRWRSSSKTTEELLEEERQRRLAQEAQTQMTQNQLGAMTGGAAPIQNVPETGEVQISEKTPEELNPFDPELQESETNPSLQTVVPDLTQIQEDLISDEELSNIGQDILAKYRESIERARKKSSFGKMEDPSELLLDGGIQKTDWSNSLKNYLREHSKTYRNYEGLTPVEAAQKFASKFLTHFTGREYYGLASELHDDGKPAKKRQRDNDFYKLADIQDEETRRLVQNNMIKNLKLDPNDPATYEKIKSMDVVVPKSTSTLQKQLKNSENMADYIAENYEKLKNNPGYRDYGSTTFERPSKERAKFHPVKSTDEGALFSVLNKADRSSKVNEDGSMDIMINDLYDFDYIDPETQNGWIAKRYADINNNAYNQQEAGQLQKYGLSIPIHLTKEEVEVILNKRANPSAYEKLLRKLGLGIRL